MISNEIFREKLLLYGTSPGDWPLRWRLVLPLLLGKPQYQESWHQAQRQELQLVKLYRTMPELTPDQALRRRLDTIAQRPQVAPTAYSAPLWRLGMSTALASVLLGFMLGVGGLLPMGEVAESDLDIVSNYDVSAWLAGEGE